MKIEAFDLVESCNLRGKILRFRFNKIFVEDYFKTNSSRLRISFKISLKLWPLEYSTVQNACKNNVWIKNKADS